MAKKATKAEYTASPVRHLEEDIFNEAVQGRGGGHWAGTFFGLAYGAAAGALIGTVPGFFMEGGFSSLSLNAVAGTSAALGTLGALQGRAAGSENGSASGAAVGSTKVLLSEMRQQFKGLKKEISELKERIEPGSSQRMDETPAEPAEMAATQNRGGYIKWQTGILSALLGAAVGLVAFAAAKLIGVDVIGDTLAKVNFSGATAPLGAALVGGASGAFFGFNVPLITAKMHMTARQCINQRVFERAEEPALAHEPTVAPTIEPHTPTRLDEQVREAHFARMIQQERVAAPETARQL